MTSSLRDILAARQPGVGEPAPEPQPEQPVAAVPAPPAFIPQKVDSLDQAGLRPGMVTDLIVKALYVRGQVTPMDLMALLKLPYYGVIEPQLRELVDQELCYVSGGQMSPTSYTYTITG